MKSLIVCANVLLIIITSALMLITLHMFYSTTTILSIEALFAFVSFQVPFFLFILSAFSLHFSIEKYRRGKTDKRFKDFFPVYFKSVRLLTAFFLGLILVFKLKHMLFDPGPEISLHNIEYISVWVWSTGFYAMLLAYICPNLRHLFITRKKTSVETAYPKYIRHTHWTRSFMLALSLTLLYWSSIFTLAFIAEIPAFGSQKGLLPFGCGAIWVITLLIAPGGLIFWAYYIKIGSDYIDNFSLLTKNNVIVFENVTDTIYDTLEIRIGGFLRTYYTFQFTFKDGSIIKRSYTELLGKQLFEELKLHKQLNLHEGHITPEKQRNLLKYTNYLGAVAAAMLIAYKICKQLSH